MSNSQTLYQKYILPLPIVIAAYTVVVALLVTFITTRKLYAYTSDALSNALIYMLIVLICLFICSLRWGLDSKDGMIRGFTSLFFMRFGEWKSVEGYIYLSYKHYNVAGRMYEASPVCLASNRYTDHQYEIFLVNSAQTDGIKLIVIDGAKEAIKCYEAISESLQLVKLYEMKPPED